MFWMGSRFCRILGLNDLKQIDLKRINSFYQKTYFAYFYNLQALNIW